MSSYNQVRVDPGNDQLYSPPYTSAPGYQASPYLPPSQTINVPVVETSEGGNRRRQKDNDDDSNEDESPIIPSKYLDLEFEACFREHKSTRTVPQIYDVFGHVFKYTKLILYNILVIVFGIFFAVIWGILFGFISFAISWLLYPSLKVFLLVVNSTIPAVTEPLKAFITPLVDVHARIFRQIKVKASLDGGLMSPFAKSPVQIAQDSNV